MAQQDGQVNIALKITADNDGVNKAEKGLDRVGKAAKHAADQSKSGFAQMQGAVGKVTGAFSTLHNIITGFGIVGLVMPIVNAFKSWRDEIKRTEERAKALNDELALKSAAAEVKAVADAYRDLNDAIKATAESRARDNELFNEEVRLRREAEDADSSAAEADALAAVDPNAADADRQRETIRARFSANRQRTAANRKIEDIVFRRQNLEQQATDANAAADQLEASLAGDDKAILRKTIRANTLAQFSQGLNEKDGTWYNRNKRTAEGDAERDRLRKEAETARAEAEQLKKAKADKEKQIADLRASATHANKLRDVLYTGIATAETQRDTATVNENTATAITAAADNRQAAELAAAKRNLKSLAATRADLQERIKLQQERKSDAGLAVFQAQNKLDLANANGNSRAIGSATADLAAAREAALSIGHSADTAINDLTALLQDVEKQFNSFKSVLERHAKQQANFTAEAPAGA